MSTATPVPTVPKVRTYAADLTATRALRGTMPKSATTQPVTTSVVATKKISTAKKTVTPAAPIIVPPSIKKVSQPLQSDAALGVTEKPIPPFHTLQKSADKNPLGVPTVNTDEFTASQKSSKASVLATPGVEQLTVNSKTAVEATVITDTKRKKLSISGAILTALGDWWHQKKKVAAERKKPKYTVPEADRRKGVIQKATTQTGRASTADHEAALARIKAAKKTPRHAAPVRTTTVATPATGWSTEPTPEPVVEAVVTQKITPVIPPTPSVEVPATKPNSVPPIAKQEAATISEKLAALERATTATTDESTPHNTTTSIAPTPVSRPRITPVVPPTSTVTNDDVVTETEEDPVLDTDNSETTSDTPTKTIPRWSQSIALPTATPVVSFSALISTVRTNMQRTNHLAVGIAGICAGATLAWLGVHTYLATSTDTTVVTALPHTTFETSTRITPATPITNKTELAESLHTQSGSDSLTELELRNQTTNQPLSASEFFALLGASVDVNFAASARDVSVGQYHDAPWIVIQTGDTATARGGMLAWEDHLSSDLAPWFGDKVTADIKAGITLFHDGVIATRDVRILTDKTGTERIVYGFIAGDQLLITTNTTTFLNLSEKSTQK